MQKNILKIKKFIVRYVLEFIQSKTEKNQVILELFECCFNFLLAFVKNDNKENKKCLFTSIGFFLSSIDYFDVGQIEFICEIFKNNYKLSIQITEDMLSIFYSKLLKRGHDLKF